MLGIKKVEGDAYCQKKKLLEKKEKNGLDRLLTRLVRFCPIFMSEILFTFLEPVCILR